MNDRMTAAVTAGPVHHASFRRVPPKPRTGRCTALLAMDPLGDARVPPLARSVRDPTTPQCPRGTSRRVSQGDLPAVNRRFDSKTLPLTRGSTNPPPPGRYPVVVVD